MRVRRGHRWEISDPTSFPIPGRIIRLSPDGGRIVGGSRLIEEHSVGQVLVQVSAFHVLGDHAERVAAHTHPQETDDVGVLQAGQDLHLFQEVVSTRGTREKEASVGFCFLLISFFFKINSGEGSGPRLQLCLALQLICLFYWSACLHCLFLTNCPAKAAISHCVSSYQLISPVQR